ncbi:hypothetical protein SAMN04487900_11014 [Prevotella communis]|uniref:Uncharacterized protein n=1 Tax=Prevotella communis TaxID=2913614 RepID=A0A1H0GWU9_9BACT|nr:hypothetical protein [Prevotella communis]SDO11373.1 hypothetical protein SAMN04487900_11014 [Prevotella communis]
MKIKGAFPVRWQAQDGQPGTGVTVDRMNSFTKYAASTSGTTHPADSSSDWKQTVPTVADGSYLWTWVHVAYSDGSYTDAYSVSRMGIDGRGIQSSVVTYSQQASPVDPATITNWGAFPSSLTDGYWLYTKTHVVYSDGDTTDSYSVSQIGVGAYYAGCQEYWATSNSDTTPPSGYPNTKSFVDGVATYANGETCSVSGSWSTDRPSADNSAPYIWNFEISYDSRGNKYVTRPICIGNFAKGIASIVEAYAISAYGSPNSNSQAYPTDIASSDWQDEQHAVAPTNAKRYQWNRTTVNYNNGSPDVFYHVSAVKGADGIGATYLDLDNENDSMLYDGNGTLLSGNAVSNIRLYSNGQRVQNPPTFSIQEKSASVTASISGSVLTVTGITSDSGYVIVQCTYNNEPYTTRMTIKRLQGEDKYELELSPNSVSYNETDGVASTTTIRVYIWRTGQNGVRTKVTDMSDFNLYVKYQRENTTSYSAKKTAFDSGKDYVSLSIDPASYDYFRFILGIDDTNQTVLDTETVIVGRVENGGPGEGAVVVDLDNENDSMLYDGAGNLVSGNVVSNAKLLVGAEDKTSDTSWALGSYSGMASSQVSISGNTVTVTGMSADASSGYVDVVGTYGGQPYTKRLTLKKLRGVDKFELVCTPSALTYNESGGSSAQQDVNIKVYRTAQNGARTLVQSLSTYGLKLRYYWITNGIDAGPTEITDGTAAGYYNSGVTKSVYASMYTAYRYELLNSGNLILDSETVPIGHVSNGTGTKGADAKSIYKNSFLKPSKPTGSSPSGWSTEPSEVSLKVQPQGDWSLADDGFMAAPPIANNQTSVETFSFITTEANQTFYFRLRCSVGSYDNVYIGQVDSVAPVANYIRKVNGTSQDTGDLSVTIPTAGAHFICVAYVRGNSGSSSYVKFICGSMFLWKSDAVTFNTDGTVSVWSTPYKVSGNDEAFTTEQKANQLLQTNFLASRMDKWITKNGATTEGTGGRNGYVCEPAIDDVLKEMLQQKMYEVNGEKRLQANTWYTLSFWAKADPYIQINKNETSIYYGFATQICYFAPNIENQLVVNGYCSSTARSAGEELRVFVYNDDWSWSTSVAITSTYATSATLNFTLPAEGKYFITAYVYKSGGVTPAEGKTCTVNWYRINRGMKFMTYLYPHTNSGESQTDYTCIDFNAGKIVDGVVINGGNSTDNHVDWQLTEVWTKHTMTFKTRSNIPARDQAFLMRLWMFSNKTYVCMPKIEQGTVATDYCTNDSDISELASDTVGYPRERGVYVDTESFVWNDDFRDFIDYEFDGTWYRYGVKKKGMIIPAGTPPTLVGGDSNWEVANRIKTLITDTIFGANANIGGFMASASQLLSKNGSLLLDGVGGLIRLLHTDGYRWEVMPNGMQMLGIQNGKRIELDPSTKKIIVYDETGSPCVVLDGNIESSIDNLFSETSGSDSKSISFTCHAGASEIVQWDNYVDWEVFVSDAIHLTSPGRIKASGYYHLAYKGDVYWSGGALTNPGQYYPECFSVGDIAFYLYTYSDASCQNLVSRKLIRSYQIDTMLWFGGSQGYVEEGWWGTGGFSDDFHNLTFDAPAGYNKLVIAGQAQMIMGSDDDTRFIVEITGSRYEYTSNIYLNRLFGNGVSFGTNNMDNFVVMNENSHIHARCKSNNQYGFDISPNGIKIFIGGAWFLLGYTGITINGTYYVLPTLSTTTV